MYTFCQRRNIIVIVIILRLLYARYRTVYLQAGLLRNVLDESLYRRPTAVGTASMARKDGRKCAHCGDERETKTEMTKNKTIITIPYTTHTRATSTHGMVDLINASDDNDHDDDDDYDDDNNNNNMSIARRDELNPAANHRRLRCSTQSMLLFTFCRSVSLCHREIILRARHRQSPAGFPGRSVYYNNRN